MVSRHGWSSGRQPCGAPREGARSSRSSPRPSARKLASAATAGPPRRAAAPSARTAPTALR
eukprot:10859722-Lingulodinium_polyedra.AAC.1